MSEKEVVVHRNNNINGEAKKKYIKHSYFTVLSMLHGHNERLVSISYVFVKDGCAILKERRTLYSI